MTKIMDNGHLYLHVVPNEDNTSKKLVRGVRYIQRSRDFEDEFKFDDILFEDRYDDDETGTVTLYFMAPKELVEYRYPEAESTEISLEYPESIPVVEHATVQVSPTKGCCDYDWFDVFPTPDFVDALFKLANEKEPLYVRDVKGEIIHVNS